MQRVVTLDDRIAWAHYEFTDELLNGNTVEEWISLSGKQGDDKEGVINVILSFTVSQSYIYIYCACTMTLPRYI